eukprot:3271195-Amphidinium_carterae.1
MLRAELPPRQGSQPEAFVSTLMLLTATWYQSFLLRFMCLVCHGSCGAIMAAWSRSDAQSCVQKQKIV